MPTYSYECQKCTKEFDVVKSMKDSDSPESCPACASAKTIKLLTAPPRGNLNFKGKGFYETEHGTQRFNRNK